MSYRILIIDDDSLKRNYSYADSYICKGLTAEELSLLSFKRITNGWEEALNIICSVLHLKLISAYPCKDKNDLPKIAYIFETIESNNTDEAVSM